MSLQIRRGGVATSGGSGGAPTYGPTNGAAVVRSGAGPRTVSDPGGGIAFNSSASLQAAINANAAGSLFVCSVNNPVWNSNVQGTTKAPRIYFPGPIGQKVIDGGGADIIAINTGTGGEIHGGTWQNFGAPGLAVAPIVHGIQLGDSGILEDAQVTACKVSGVAVVGNNARISRCKLYDNGLSGLQGSQDGTVLEYCEITGNNVSGNNPGNEGGAFKLLFGAGDWVHDNYIWGNHGFGLWMDTQNQDCLIEENVCENNERSGLFYEASYGSVIRRNYIVDNGRTGSIGGQTPSFENCVNARIADSDCSLGSGTRGSFERNYIDYTLAPPNSNFGGLLLLWHHAGGSGTSLNRTQRNFDVKENQLWLRGTQDQRVGGEDTASVETDVWDAGNSFFSNEYHVASTSVSYWKWDTTGGSGIAKTFAQWQTFHPTGETRLVI